MKTDQLLSNELVIGALSSEVLDLNVLLEDVCASLQLTLTQRKKADGHYRAVGEWLNTEGSLLAPLRPDIYSQGSLRIGTTAKPIKYNEFDADSVLESAVNPGYFAQPVDYLDLLEQRLCENETYRKMLERKNRCIRLNYEGDFHFDILPACKDPASGIPGAILVPDRELKTWKASNPKGFAAWFLNRTSVTEYRIDAIEPLPDFQKTVPLQRAVQMLKRNRDLFFKKQEDLTPASIVLTTLAAENYIQQRSIVDAMGWILGHLLSQIRAQRIHVFNPTNPNELLSERWIGNPDSYSAYVEWVIDLNDKWTKLRTETGIQKISLLLRVMFGESVVQDALLAVAARTDAFRKSGNLSIKRGSAGIVSGLGTGTLPIRKNTFFGD